MSSEMRELVEAVLAAERENNALLREMEGSMELDAAMACRASVATSESLILRIEAALLARTEAGAACDDEGCPHRGTTHECRGGE